MQKGKGSGHEKDQCIDPFFLPYAKVPEVTHASLVEMIPSWWNVLCDAVLII